MVSYGLRLKWLITLYDQLHKITDGSFANCPPYLLISFIRPRPFKSAYNGHQYSLLSRPAYITESRRPYNTDLRYTEPYAIITIEDVIKKHL